MPQECIDARGTETPPALPVAQGDMATVEAGRPKGSSNISSFPRHLALFDLHKTALVSNPQTTSYPIALLPEYHGSPAILGAAWYCGLGPT